MTKVVSMINWKGGVGKTTLTLHIACALAEFHNKSVLLIDLDPQCNLSFLSIGSAQYISHAYTQKKFTLKNVFDDYFLRKNTDINELIQKRSVQANAKQIYTALDIILSHQELTLLDMKLARDKRSGKDHREETKFEIEKLSIIKNIIDSVAVDYDFILLDCPPNVNLVTQNAFFASDFYVIPAIPDFLSTVGISLIRQYMDQFNADYKSMWAYANCSGFYTETKFCGVIFNMVDEYGGGPKDGHRQIINNIKKQEGNTYVYDNYVTDGDGISTASQMNLPVFAVDHLPRSQNNAKKQSGQLQQIASEFLTKIK